LDTGVGAGSHSSTLGVVDDVPEMAVDIVSSLSGNASGEHDEGEDKSTDSNHRVDRYRK
jgi:hypothetical protein